MMDIQAINRETGIMNRWRENPVRELRLVAKNKAQVAAWLYRTRQIRPWSVLLFAGGTGAFFGLAQSDPADSTWYTLAAFVCAIWLGLNLGLTCRCECCYSGEDAMPLDVVLDPERLAELQAKYRQPGSSPRMAFHDDDN